ncbi:MAG TPA: hypothetical protein VMT19_04150 [Thermoanaerobaculaceae bacterium]|nr:hypothetical protein [Thermoanaerobaculaceae bacterium]
MSVPAIRVRRCNGLPVRGDGAYIVYWMTAFRRAGWNFALERAVEHARALRKPLVVLEAVRSDHRWASERVHTFVLAGMADNRRAFRESAVTYLPYVEPAPGAGRGLLAALAADACVVVADDAPVFFLPRAVGAAAARAPVLLEAVDSNGLLPLAATGRVFPTAFAFRRFLHSELPAHLAELPAADPLRGVELSRLASVPETVVRGWPAVLPDEPGAVSATLAVLPLDRSVHAVAGTPGGTAAGRARIARFVSSALEPYAEVRDHPDDDGTSGLSPYLHFGHVSAHEVFAAVARHQGWTAERLAPRPSGKRSGWWGMGEAAEAFLDQLVTWRELGFNFAAKRDDGETYESLPPWALATLGRHASDPRPRLYPAERLEQADTHDPLWSAAQRQLLREGRIHNRLRMLWGKKILEWSPSPREALAVMLELNNRWALDGPDPNSASGIMWCLGRYDRPWGPERPVFGTVRFMSSESTSRKARVREYLARYGA